MSDPTKYAWISDGGRDVAYCISALPGATVAEVVARLGLDTSRTLDFDDAYGEGVAVVAAPSGVLVVEPNGFQGSVPEVLERIAGGGRAASAFWNVDGDDAFTWVTPEVGVRSVELLDAEEDDDEESMTELGLPRELHPL